MAIATIVLFGLIYPLLMTGIAQVLFPRQANGSLIRQHGVVIGSTLIGQQFTAARYFHSRPSAAGKGYDASASGGSNLGPTNRALVRTVQGRIEAVRKEKPTLGKVPVDMVTSSASGLDPDITLANAYAQAPRIARERGISSARIMQLIRANTTSRSLGFLGEPRVNVLRVNRALNAMSRTNR